jgi:hypothetical protein
MWIGSDGARMSRYLVGVSSYRAFHVTGMRVRGDHSPIISSTSGLRIVLNILNPTLPIHLFNRIEWHPLPIMIIYLEYFGEAWLISKSWLRVPTTVDPVRSKRATILSQIPHLIFSGILVHNFSDRTKATLYLVTLHYNYVSHCQTWLCRHCCVSILLWIQLIPS